MKKINLHKVGETIENQYHEVIARGIYHMVKGFFHFKKRKGELFAASGTFFSLLSLPPLILLVISMVHYFTGDVDVAKIQVLSSMKDTFPQIAPWIMTSIESIVSAQLTTSNGMNWLNIGMLLYSGLGVVAAIMYGLNKMAGSEPRGGFIFDDLRSFAAAVLMTTFFISMIFLTQEHVVSAIFGNSTSIVSQFFMKFYQSAFFLPLVAMGFFTMFFKIATSKVINFKRATLGAFAFVITFSAGRSFYWVYLHYAKQELELSFGNFYTIVVVVLWTYFAMCSLFYGSAVAYQDYMEDATKSQLPSEEVTEAPAAVAIADDQQKIAS